MLRKDALCTCGKPISECVFWKPLLIDSKNEYEIVNHYNFFSYLKALNFLFNPFVNSIKFKLEDDHRLITDVKASVSKDVEFILDSSKDPVRLLALTEDPRFEVTNITVIRDAKGTATSFSGAGFGRAKSFYITLFKWLFINSFLRVYHNRYSKQGRSYLVSYEKFTQDPESYRVFLNKELGINIPDNYVEIVPQMDNYHNLGGNRSARPDKRKDFTGIYYRKSWEKNSKFKNKLADILVGRFNRKWTNHDSLN